MLSCKSEIIVQWQINDGYNNYCNYNNNNYYYNIIEFL